MIRTISINIPVFINNWLPVHRRKYAWLSFLQVLLAPFRIMMTEYLLWRDKSITRAYVNGETISLQWYLNYLFDPVNTGIYFITPGISGVLVALESELVPVILAGLESETTEVPHFKMVPLPGEDIQTGTADFAVMVPAALSGLEPAIRKVIVNYKLAGKSYVIIYY